MLQRGGIEAAAPPQILRAGIAIAAMLLQRPRIRLGKAGDLAQAEAQGAGLQMIVPAAEIDVGRQYRDAMIAGVAHDLRRGVEAHRLAVEQGAGERRQVMAFEPGRDIDQMGEAGGVALRKAVIAEALDLLEDPLGEVALKRDFAERVFKQIQGFGDYGFPESHAASFAHLVYVSAWLKCHYLAAFACALLNSQPMGFYAPAQIVRDARDHGVAVLPPDINFSRWDNHLETGALRLGLRQITGFSEADARTLEQHRGDGYASPEDLWRRSGLDSAALKHLADADAFGSIGLPRRQALWAVRALGAPLPPLFAAAGLGAEQPVVLPKMTMGEQVVEDYAHLRLSLKTHPLALMRRDLAAENIVPARGLESRGDGKRVVTEGLVLVRQRPGTSSGVIFLTLEDETGVCNVVVWPHLYEKARAAVLSGRLLRIAGKLQVEDGVVHLVAERIFDRTAALTRLADAGLKTTSRDFH